MKNTIITIIAIVWAVMLQAQTTTSYEYDSFGRLIRATTGTTVQQYSYDALGNRLIYTVTGNASPLADIQWSSASIPTTNLIKGEDYTATCELANTGNTSADNFVVKAYLSATPNTTDIEVGTLNINSLGSEISQSINIPIHIPATASEGNQYIVFVADVGNVVSETHEDNNRTHQAVNIMVASPDILFTDALQITPASVQDGETVTLNTSVSNQGTVIANDVAVKAYLSLNQYFESYHDVLLPEGNAQYTNIGVSTTQTYNKTVTIPENTVAGTYYILVVADPDNNIEEPNESNNIVLASVEITNTFTGTVPIADFNADQQNILEGNSIQFTDASTNSPTSWLWTFQGGNPATSNVQNPLITYNQEGVYNVSLTVSNASGVNSMIKTGYVVVGQNQTVVFGITPSSHDFGEVMLSETSNNTFVITNNGTATLTINDFEVIGIHANDFICQGVDGIEVEPNGGTYSFNVIFNPQLVGDKTATLTIATNTTEGEYEVSLIGKAINNTLPSVEVPTITVENMCGYSILTASNYSGTLSWNTGESTESITVTEDGVYSVTQTVSETTSAAATTTVTIKPIPDAPTVTVDNQVGQSVLTAGNYSGDLLWSNNATTASITVTTAGTYSVTQTIDGCTSPEGSGVANPTISSTITPNAPTITVENMCGYSVLTASNYSGTLSWSTGESTESITVNTAGVYSVTQTVSGTTSAVATTTVTIKPIPDAPIVMVDNQVGQSVLTAGNYTGSLLWSNGETSESITVTTAGIYSVTQTVDGCTSPEGSGEASPLYPLFDITPTSHDFGEVEVSQDATQIFTITNNGTATLVLTMFEINGSADFTHNGVDNTEVAPNGGTYTFSATFAPQIEGEQTATITITDNITRETHDVILTGNGKISSCDYWIGNCDICGCFDTQAEDIFELNVSVGTNGSMLCPEDNSGTWAVVAMPAGLTATPTFTDIHNYNTTFNAPIPGDYILRYTWGALYNNQYLEARYRIVEKPIISIHGDEVVNICKSNEYALSDDREYNTETLTYSWSIEGGTISGSTTGESVEVQWDNQAGTATLTASAWYSDYDVCSRTVEFTVEKKNPTFAGQVKYWNQYETYMPSPYQTCDYCTNPHDYFYVTLLHNGDGLATKKVEPRLTEDLTELMSYFEFDIDVAQYGCDAEFALRIWDGGLVYHDNLPAGQPTNTHLGANYTYKHFGSVNATDALAIQLMVGGANNINAAPYNYKWVGLNTDTPQYGFYSHSIADVNSSNPYANGGITALDALTVKYRSVGLIANYPDNGSDNEFSPNYRVAGRMVPELPYTTFPEPFDWDNEDDIDFRHSGAEYEYMSPARAHYYESQPFAWNSRNYSFINIYYNLVGDINSSYTPEGNISKRDSDVELAYEEAVSAQVGEEVTLPIRINNTEKLGAITLGMTYRNDLIEVLSTNYDKANGEYHIDTENGVLNIAWYDSYGKTFANDEAIAYITVKVLQPISENTELFSLASTTEFADVNAHKLEGIRLSTYNLNNNTMPESSTFSSMNYPNPFKTHTTIAYTLPESGEVNIAVYDLTGRLVKHLISETQTAGTHTIEYSAPRGLNSGLLIYKITLNGNDGVKTITKKMSVGLVSNR